MAASYVGSSNSRTGPSSTSDQSKVSRERMPLKDAKKLTKNYVYLEENIDATYLTSYLFSNFIILEEDMTTINKIPDKLNRNRELLNTLLNRGDRAFDIFIIGLKQNNYDTAVDLLRKNLDSEMISDLNEKKEDIRLKIDTLERQITLLKKSNSDLKKSNSDLKKSSSDLKNIITEQKELIQQRDNTISSQQKTIQALHDEIRPLQTEMGQLKSENSEIRSENSKIRSENSEIKNRLKAIEQKMKKK